MTGGPVPVKIRGLRMIEGKQLRPACLDVGLLSLVAAVCLLAVVPGTLAFAQSSGSTSTSGWGGAVYTGTIDLTGAFTLSAQFTSDPDESSCADVGKGETPFSLSVGNLPAGGHSLYILVETPNLPAPDANGSISVQSVGSNFGIDHDIYVQGENDALIVNSDGSGSFTFTNASDIVTDQTLSGTLNWTCSS